MFFSPFFSPHKHRPIRIAQVEMEYFIATNDEDIYFMAMNLRQDLLADREAMVHTTLQKVISVLHCKQRMERVTGPLSPLKKYVAIINLVITILFMVHQMVIWFYNH